ncbi:unnamed protein product, partial [Cylicostephanus goldi]
PTYWVNAGVWVEIYYTEDVPLWWGRFDNIQTTGIFNFTFHFFLLSPNGLGAGTSKIGGLPNNKHCERCNLYPVPYPDEVVTLDDEGNGAGVADITVAEDPLNSTFRVLMNERKGDAAEEWEDVAEVICSLCSTATSDANIDAALLTMDKELEKCRDIMVKKAANM